jgi:uncharacterized membrane protein YbhN (UPF0104 family)
MSVPEARGESSSSERRDWSWLLGVVVSLTALVIAVWGVDIKSFVGVLSGASYFLLIPAYLLQSAGIAARARGWKSLLGPQVPFRRAFAAINEGYLINNILPLRLGELARAYLVGHSGIGASRALGSIVVERTMDVSIAVLSVLVTVPLFAPPEWATRAALGVGLALVALIGGLALIVRSRAKAIRWLAALPPPAGPSLSGIAGRFLLGLDEARQQGRLRPALAWMLLGWGCAWVQFWLFLRMFGASGGPGVAVFALGLIALGGAVPSSPGAVGVYELAGVAGLTFLGYPREVALGVVITAHLVQYSLVLVLGGLFLAREGRSIGDLARAARGLVLRPAG